MMCRPLGGVATTMPARSPSITFTSTFEMAMLAKPVIVLTIGVVLCTECMTSIVWSPVTTEVDVALT